MAFQSLVCSHTTKHTIPHIIQQHHTPPQGPTRPHRIPHMAGRPPGKKRKRGGFQPRAAGRFGGKPAPPPEPLAAHTRPQHENDTCYEGDEEDHSSSGSSQHSSDSDLSSCGSCSSRGVKYDGKSKRQARRRHKMRRDLGNKLMLGRGR